MNSKGFSTPALTWLIAGVAVIIIVAGGLWLVRSSRSDNVGEKVQVGSQADAGATKSACDILTDAAAKSVIGDGATKADLPGDGGASTDDVSVTNCLYSSGEGDSALSASVLVRGAKNTGAYSGNQYGYEQTKTQSLDGGNTASSAPLPGIGDSAYFNDSFGQVNVLISGGKYWIIVQVSKGTSFSGDRELGEKLAKLVVANL